MTVTTEQLTGEAIRYLNKNAWMTVTEVYDPALRDRIDVFALKTEYAGDGYIACVEVKVSKRDLRRDFESAKNQYFVEHCDFFYYAVPPDLVQELKLLAPASFGILTLNKDGNVRCARRPLINPNRQIDYGLFPRAFRRVYDAHAWSYDAQLERLKTEIYAKAEQRIRKEYEKKFEEQRKQVQLWTDLKNDVLRHRSSWWMDDSKVRVFIFKCIHYLEKINRLKNVERLEDRIEAVREQMFADLKRSEDGLKNTEYEMTHVFNEFVNSMSRLKKD